MFVFIHSGPGFGKLIVLTKGAKVIFSNPKLEALIASIIEFKISSDYKILFAAILLQVVYLIGILFWYMHGRWLMRC